ncbi:MAG: hypothetical protein KBD47_02070 [Candidatus Pacebacteria bacterium]|jgi:hypothetical protein|nr:hypothetical protein [Candidatus Paceibacterota bacterium]
MNSTSKLAVALFGILYIVAIMAWPGEKIEKRSIPYNHYPIGTGVVGGK